MIQFLIENKNPQIPTQPEESQLALVKLLNILSTTADSWYLFILPDGKLYLNSVEGIVYWV